jgi:hypothetical protein
MQREMRTSHKIVVRSSKEARPLEGPRYEGGYNIKLYLTEMCEDVNRTQLAKDRIHFRADFCEHDDETSCSIKQNFLTS